MVAHRVKGPVPLRRIARLIGPGLLVGAALCAPVFGQLAPLVPLDDSEVNVPLLPPGVIKNAPELYGDYVYVWGLEDGTQVIQYHGDFVLQLGDRRLKAQEAVVWMQKSVWNSTAFYHFEVFLSHNAEVVDSAGTVNTGPLLFVTFNTTQPPTVQADIHTTQTSGETKLYAEAMQTRDAVQNMPATQPSDMQTVQPGARRPLPQPKARPLVRHTAKDEEYNEHEGIVVATGDVYLSQGLVDSTEFLEIRADAAVLFLADREQLKKAMATSKPARTTGRGALEPFPEETPEQPKAAKGRSPFGGIQAAISGAYLKGNVVLTRGERSIRASELYYDFQNDRALILDAVMRAVAGSREIPIYVRAEQVRQLSNTEYFARKAQVSASEFHTPHLSIGAERIFLTDETPRNASGQITNFEAGKYRMYDTTLNVEGVPVAYWPYSAGDFRQTQTSLKSARFAFSNDFGASFDTRWYLFNLLGIQKPEGVDATLRLDYFSKKGPGVGVDVDYSTEDRYGLFRGYYIHDTGHDNLGPFRKEYEDPPTENRGRLLVRHRELLPKGWELTLEASYISDPNFLEEYFNAEYEEGKEQETLLYLKKQQDNWAFTALAQWRVLDWLTQTEHFPDLGFHWIGEPIGDFGSFYDESHLGFARYKPDDRQVYSDFKDSRITARADSRNEVDFPIKLGDANVTPFAMARTDYWDDSPFEGSLGRLFGMLGVRSGTQFWRCYDTESRLFDVHGVRHIIKPEVTGWMSGSNKDSQDLYPFDQGIESINDFYGSSLALRQAWQTKRGGPGQWRTVDWITFDVELNLFGNQPNYQLPIGRYYDSRPENSIARDHVRTDFKYRISDTTAILSETNWDLNDKDLDLFDVSYAVERTPRFSYFVGYRRVADISSNLVGGGVNYKINDKYTFAGRTFYDLDRNELEELEVSIIRKWPRWYTALTFGLDNVPRDVSLSLSAWPEGAPRATLGNRRYSALSESTGIRPEN
jgi:lipopolysaccharide assembly outer membrane protein LptD (OstA)